MTDELTYHGPDFRTRPPVRVMLRGIPFMLTKCEELVDGRWEGFITLRIAKPQPVADPPAHTCGPDLPKLESLDGLPLTASELGAARKTGMHYTGLRCWCGVDHPAPDHYARLKGEGYCDNCWGDGLVATVGRPEGDGLETCTRCGGSGRLAPPPGRLV